VAKALNKLIDETKIFLEDNDDLLKTEFPNIEESLLKTNEESKIYFKSKLELYTKTSESNLNENFLTDQEKELAAFLLKRNRSLCEEARRTNSTQSMNDDERFILGLWLAEDIANIKNK
jgi:hypothetical protein